MTIAGSDRRKDRLDMPLQVHRLFVAQVPVATFEIATLLGCRRFYGALAKPATQFCHGVPYGPCRLPSGGPLRGPEAARSKSEIFLNALRVFIVTPTLDHVPIGQFAQHP